MAERNLKRVRLNLWFCTVSLLLIDVLRLIYLWSYNVFQLWQYEKQNRETV